MLAEIQADLTAVVWSIPLMAFSGLSAFLAFQSEREIATRIFGSISFLLGGTGFLWFFLGGAITLTKLIWR